MSDLTVPLAASADCPRCIGGSRVDGSTCSTCRGSGSITVDDSWGVAS